MLHDLLSPPPFANHELGLSIEALNHDNLDTIQCTRMLNIYLVYVTLHEMHRPLDILDGCIQRSMIKVLGPFIFNLYMMDLCIYVS